MMKLAKKITQEQTIVSEEQLNRLYELSCALDGLLELCRGGDERSINCRSLHALLEPIGEGLTDLYCELGNRQAE